MLKKELTYEDVDGNEVTGTFYFGTNNAEMLEMELRFGDEGLEKHFKKVVESGNRGALLDLYKYILVSTVGRREGNQFIKNQQIRDDFEFGGAYSAMFMDLFNNPAGILEFFREVLPRKMQATYQTFVDQELAKDGDMPTITPDNVEGGKGYSPTITIIDESMTLPPGGDGYVANVIDPDEAGTHIELTPAGEKKLLEEIFGPDPDAKPAEPKRWDEYTRAELLDLSTSEFKELMGKDRHNVPRTLLNIAFERSMKKIDE